MCVVILTIIVRTLLYLSCTFTIINSISTLQLDVTKPVDCGVLDRLSKFNGGHPVWPIEQTKQNIFFSMEQNHYSENSILRSLTLHFPLIYAIRGESNGKLPPRTCPGCSVPEPYRSHDWALVPASPASKAEY